MRTDFEAVCEHSACSTAVRRVEVAVNSGVAVVQARSALQTQR